MTVGQWRDRFPRVTLTLPGLSGPLDVEFVVDTGFDGEIAVPETLIRRLELTILDARFVQLAGGFRQRCYSFEMVLDGDEETRRVDTCFAKPNSPPVSRTATRAAKTGGIVPRRPRPAATPGILRA